MKKYFTTLENVNNQFVATVFESNTNLEVYKTKPHWNQFQAIKDVNDYIANRAPAQETLISTTTKTIINTNTAPSTSNLPSNTPKRCCGRG